MALPANWRIAGSILTLRNQLRPLAPNAPAVAFGTVADAAHGTSGEHYPKVYPGLGSRPVVCAGDFPKAGNLNPRAVLDNIRRSKDLRVKYGISNGQMFSSYAAHGYPAWVWRPYSGSDGHFDHGHLSVVGDARADDTRPWAISGGAAPPSLTPGGFLMALTDEQQNDMWVWLATLVSGSVARPDDRFKFTNPFPGWQRDLNAQLTAMQTTVNGLRTTVDALAQVVRDGGGDIDTAAVLARIDQRAAEEVAREQELRTELATVKEELERRRAADLAKARAETNILDDDATT